MKEQPDELTYALKKHFGFNQFKGLQRQVVTSIMACHNVFVIMPTGGGKSLCYQLPALIKPGTTVVISPLIALMKNQVDALRTISENPGVAHVLNSSLNKSEVKQVMDDVRQGVCKLLYVAPESLVKEENANFLKTSNISFFAVDEAHCISEWGHDFRPEYRNIKNIIQMLGNRPIIALTATATPKVQEDIKKNLGMKDACVFKDSFNRPNLFYEVRPKKDVDKAIIRYIKENPNKPGIIYCLSRKKVEELSDLLKVNDIEALSYHAGLDTKMRSKHQDMFLKGDADVIVATIAFGMGIDKPDVRFVIHYDMPKSLEGYYQETGRAGRDGGQGHCLAFYDPKDIEKLEKFLASKPVSEREIGMQLLSDVADYAETAISRRKFLLHYFGEEFDEINGPGALMDDNTKNPKKKSEAKQEILSLLQLVQKTHQRLKAKELVYVLMGKENALIKSYKLDKEPFFGKGNEKSEFFWHSAIRQAMVHKYLQKEIETYGTIKLTEKANEFIKQPTSFMMIENFYENDPLATFHDGSTETLMDNVLWDKLHALRKKMARENNIPYYAIFQDPSLNEMAVQYPVNTEELSRIQGVGEGKAKKFGSAFIEIIKTHVAENGILRAEDFVLKSVANKSNHKIYIIQNIDRKMSLDDIAQNRGLSIDLLITEMERIVYTGTKLNIQYHLDTILDEDQQDELFQYFIESDSDRISVALDALDGEYTEEEVRLMRIKFLSEVAN